MKFIKKYWYFTIITIITLGLGVVTFLTSQQLTKTTPVAPNVPQEKPKAAEEACTLTFNLNITPTVTDTPTPTLSITSTNTPTHTPTPTGTSATECNGTCTVNADCGDSLVCISNVCRNTDCTDETDCTCPSGSTPTPTPVLSGCNFVCTVNTDCTSGLVCLGGYCRNPGCTEKTSCVCEIATALTPETPVSGSGPTVLGASIISGAFILILLGLAL